MGLYKLFWNKLFKKPNDPHWTETEKKRSFIFFLKIENSADKKKFSRKSKKKIYNFNTATHCEHILLLVHSKKKSCFFQNDIRLLPTGAKLMFGMRTTNGITWHWISQLIELN
jgi:hypothetical protein